MRDPFGRPEEPQPGDRYIKAKDEDTGPLPAVYVVNEIEAWDDPEGRELLDRHIGTVMTREAALELALWPRAEAMLREVVASYEWLLKENDEPEDFAQEVWHVIHKSHPDGAGPILGLLDLLDGEPP